MGVLQMALAAIYPPTCIGCGDMVESDFGLCGSCWGQTEFIGGASCDLCGIPLPGQVDDDPIKCDACLHTQRSWEKGRAALVYSGMGRRLVLGLKHADRPEIARPAARWMHAATRDILTEKTLIVPVPLHWSRLLKRRYNQSALIAKRLAELTGLDWCPDLLERPRRTPSLDGKTQAERSDILANAVRVSRKGRHRIPERDILLIDDVMTTGATLEACAAACQAAGAAHVCVSVLARATKRP